MRVSIGRLGALPFPSSNGVILFVGIVRFREEKLFFEAIAIRARFTRVRFVLEPPLFFVRFSPFQWTGRWIMATFLYTSKRLKNSANRNWRGF